MKAIRLKTKGMHCKSCEMLVKDSLEELEGVSKADASYKKNEVTIEYDENKANIESVRKAIEKEGYEVI